MFDASLAMLTSRFLFFAILIPSVILHEIAHGWVADKLGDPTARLAGRLTLDPRPHIDPWMTIAFPFLLIILNSPIIFGAAKPVPIDPYNFRDPKKDVALTALAGPLTNLGLAVIFALLYHLVDLTVLSGDLWSLSRTIFSAGAFINVFLALFNLFPLPPLDGFKVLLGLLPDETSRELSQLERYGFMIILLILFFFPRVIFGVIDPIMDQIISLLLG